MRKYVTCRHVSFWLESWNQLFWPQLLFFQSFLKCTICANSYRCFRFLKCNPLTCLDLEFHEISIMSSWGLCEFGPRSWSSTILTKTGLFPCLVSVTDWPPVWLCRSWSTVVEVMAWCLMAPSHYLNQCWLVINKFLLNTSKCIFCDDNLVIL